MVNAFAYGDTALVERFVEGTEVAVPVVDTGDGPRALPVVSITPDGGRLRLHRPLHRRLDRVPGAGEARRRAGRRVRPGRGRRARGARAARPVPLRPHRRRGGQVWFLEVNVAPGLTETSTVPLSVQAAGLDLGELMADLVRRLRATTRADPRRTEPTKLHDRPDVLLDHRAGHTWFKADGLPVPGHRAGAHPAHGRRGAGDQPHLLRRLPHGRATAPAGPSG